MALLTMTIEQFCIENLFFMDAVKNMVMKNGEFVKFIYSDENCIMNSVYIILPLQFTTQERNFNKTKLIYEPFQSKNIAFIHEIYNIEKSILECYHIDGKNPVYRISENMYHGNIQFNTEEGIIGSAAAAPETGTLVSGGGAAAPQAKYFIKLSGIWENSAEYGITYKFGCLI